MTTTRISAIAGWATLAVIVIGAALWSWRPWTGDPWVPTCSDLIVAMPSTVAGAWSVSEADPARNTTESVAQCEMAFATTEPRFAGRLRVFISGESDTDQLSQVVADQPCNGTTEPAATPRGYQAFRACSAVVGDFAHASVVAAKDDRWLRMTASIAISGQDPDAVLTFARDLVRKAAGQGLTLDESK